MIAGELVDSLNDAPGTARNTHVAAVRRLVKRGDIVTHTRCLGCLEEHIFEAFDGEWLCGWPTPDTKRLEGRSPRSRGAYANDISPANVTHINRTPIDVAVMLIENQNQYASNPN
ncbi:hypothetical protein VI03_25500 [Burkholderia vietnamiensis]|uniref:hypothetical protein n=1 Tax=Burkholderia vietnamiensis TaxID=60552 RepID=UPI0006217708|nr:hypothetical protein [Burkholderia vietnamiensis]KKI36129.1 hypothetical protein VI03_25500 [Burkholderia vietnamiensis]MBR8189095.1 hypothetical protein [Burkholderia vietnamiensis]HDR9174316.1 hypothetical protein [Burkholderia vietnamiensis]